MDLGRAKFNMVEQQIRPWNVLNPQVLETMTTVPRENFVPQKYRHMAFADMNIPIGDGQVMMQPKVEARLLQALEPSSNDIVLEIGTGTGHVAALLAHQGEHVMTVEIRPEFVSLAKENLFQNNTGNVEVIHGDGAVGWQSDIEFDCIFISGSVIELTDAYRELLTIGGRLVAIVGEEPVMSAILVERSGKAAWKTTYLFETHLPPLDNIPQPDRFVF